MLIKFPRILSRGNFFSSSCFHWLVTWNDGEINSALFIIEASLMGAWKQLMEQLLVTIKLTDQLPSFGKT